jgi:hypothetical protein
MEWPPAWFARRLGQSATCVHRDYRPPESGRDDRLEMRVDHTATLAAVCSVFPGARVVEVRKARRTPGDSENAEADGGVHELDAMNKPDHPAGARPQARMTPHFLLCSGCCIHALSK